MSSEQVFVRANDDGLKAIQSVVVSSFDLRRYYIDRVLFEIVKLSKGRELAIISHNGAVRHIKAHALTFLKQNFEAFQFFENPRNIYYSLAHLENMPMFSFVPLIRQQQQAVFNHEFKNYFKGLDIGMDFDERCKYDQDHSLCTRCDKLINKEICKKCPDYDTNFPVLYKEVGVTKELFDSWQVPYQLKFSGSGFHINIEFKYIKDSLDVVKRLRARQARGSLPVEDEVALSKWFIRELSEINYLTSLDTSVFDIRRIWKMPYSLDIKTGNVALPLTNEQFENFNLNIVKPENVIETIRDRGLLERFGTGEGFKNFIEGFLLG